MECSILKCVVTRTTAQAVHVLSEHLTGHWIPRSVIEGGEDVKVKDKNIWVADWFIEKEEL